MKPFIFNILEKNKERQAKERDEVELMSQIEEVWPSPEQFFEEVNEVSSSEYVDKQVETQSEPKQTLKIPQVRRSLLLN